MKDTRYEDHAGEREAHLFLKEYYYPHKFTYFYESQSKEIQLQGVDVFAFDKDKVLQIDEKCSPTYCNKSFSKVKTFMVEICSQQGYHNNRHLVGSWFTEPQRHRTSHFLFTWPSIYDGPMKTIADGKSYPEPYILSEHIQEMVVITHTYETLYKILDYCNLNIKKIKETARKMYFNQIQTIRLKDDFRLVQNLKRKEKCIVLPIPIKYHLLFAISVEKVTRSGIINIRR